MLWKNIFHAVEKLGHFFHTMEKLFGNFPYNGKRALRARIARRASPEGTRAKRGPMPKCFHSMEKVDPKAVFRGLLSGTRGAPCKP